MMSEPTRRTAMRDALATGEPRATAPVELVQEITSEKQPGFLIYLPIFEGMGTPYALDPSAAPVGFVYAPFRTGDFFAAALADANTERLALTVRDADAPDIILYGTGAGAIGSPVVERTIDVGGRDWRLAIGASSRLPNDNALLYAAMVAVAAIALAVATWLLTWSLLRSAAQARELAALSQRRSKEKDLMLGEMSHRIKNGIGRVLAISEQTARGAESLEAFQRSFNNRLHAMAAAQDTLVQARMTGAPLRELLVRELEQVFGEARAGRHISGPDVYLKEDAAQALGLVFHELATNTLKYGALSDRFCVEWHTGPHEGTPSLVLEWREPDTRVDQPPTRKGFGTRLVDMSVRGELGGTVERSFENGFRARFILPMARINEARPARGGDALRAT